MRHVKIKAHVYFVFSYFLLKYNCTNTITSIDNFVGCSHQDNNENLLDFILDIFIFNWNQNYHSKLLELIDDPGFLQIDQRALVVHFLLVKKK